MEACFCTNLEATLEQMLPWGVIRWSVEVTCAKSRALLRWEPQRPWSDQAIARTRLLLGLFSLVTLLALELSKAGRFPCR